MLNKKRVLIGISGGVDSGVAAYILKQKGFEVIGVFLDLWSEDGTVVAALDAKKVAEFLDIEFIIADYKELFEDDIIGNFIDEYKNGRTPSPCIRCNKNIKFKKILALADKLDAYYIATGHYGNVEYYKEKDCYVFKEASTDKDQSYMMYTLDQDTIKRIIMPLGEFTSKEEVRKLAKKINLPVAEKKDSQDICFIKDNDYKRFIKEYVDFSIPMGNFVDKNGTVLGRHTGIMNYTIGQRKGLGISFGKPTYVIDINATKNEIVLGDNEDLFHDTLYVREYNFIIPEEFPINCKAKIRYSAKKSDCTIYKIEDGLKVVFKEKQRAITKGQSIVFYLDDLLLGGGIII